MDQPKIHYPAVLVAAVIHFALGALWYSPVLFAPSWMAGNGLTMDMAKEITGGRMAMMYGGTFVAFIVVYYIMAHFVSYTKSTTAMQGAQTGFWLWLGFVATTLFVTITYVMKPYSVFLIDAGYWLISMIIGGMLLAVWRKKEAA